MDAQGQGFGENAELVSIGDRLEGVGYRVDKGCEVGEGEIMYNMKDVMKGPSHSTGNGCYFEGGVEGGETPAEESILKLDRSEKGACKAEFPVKVFCSTREQFEVVDTEGIRGGVRHRWWW